MNIFTIIASAKVLDHDKQIELLVKYRSTGKDEYKNQVIESNYRFIYSYANKFSHHEFSREELFHYGVIGFSKALDRFEIDRGLKIITYANTWMRDEITKHIRDNGYMIRLPANRFRQLRKAMQSEEYKKDGTLDFHNEVLLAVSSDPMSFDTPTISDSSLTIHDIIRSTADTAESTLSNSTRTKLLYAIAKLDKKEQIVIRGTFGLDSEPMTLQEAGTLAGISCERARQLRDRALTRLKSIHPELIEELV